MATLSTALSNCKRASRRLQRQVNGCLNLADQAIPQDEQQIKTHLRTMKDEHGFLTDILPGFKSELDKTSELINEEGNAATEQQRSQFDTDYDTYDDGLRHARRLMTVIEMTQAELMQASMHTSVQANPMQANHGHDVIKVKLPKLELLRFDGDKFQWKPFWDVFESSVHSNVALQPVDKLNYLFSLLSKEPMQLVSSLSLTTENYETAVSILKEYYGNTKAIVSSIYASLMNVKPPSNDTSKLRQFYVELESGLRRLESLGESITDNHWVSLIQSKLPQAVAFNLERSKFDEDWTVGSLRKALLKEIKIRESVEGRSTKVDKKEDALQSYSSGEACRSSSGLVATDKNRQRNYPCTYCEGEHYEDKCEQYYTVADRQRRLINDRRCFRCLKRGHNARDCQSKRSCYYCQSNNHHQSLCPVTFDKGTYKGSAYLPGKGNQNNSSGSRIRPKTQGSRRSEAAHAGVDQNSNSDEESQDGKDQSKDIASSMLATDEKGVLQTAMAYVQNPNTGESKKIRLFYDSGSSRTYLTVKRATQLQLKLRPTKPIYINRFLGDDKPVKVDAKQATVELFAAKSLEWRKQMTVTVVEKIADPIGRVPVPQSLVSRKFKLSDLADSLPSYHREEEIDMLIGNDYYWDLISGEKVMIADGLYAIGSPFGWILAGRVKSSGYPISESHWFVQDRTAYDLVVSDSGDKVDSKNADLSRLWDLQSIGIKEDPYISEDDQVIAEFERTIKFKDGRYQVKWPTKPNIDRLPSNYGLALGRFKSLVKKFNERPALFEKYRDIIEEQKQKGVIEPVPADEVSSSDEIRHYISHHPVETPQKTTTKVRIVYDASAKEGFKPSLNEVLYRGPIILEDLVGLLIRFRVEPVALISDIAKAFLQVGLQSEDKDLTRFLWLKDRNNLNVVGNIEEFRFCRVAFGMKSSPFLLSATIKHHLGKYGTPTAEKIRDNTYVDNIIAGTNTPREGIEFYDEAKNIFQEAGMWVREWLSNSDEVMKAIAEEDRCQNQITKVLGVPWDSQSDELCFEFSVGSMTRSVTRRSMLKAISKQFDPLGLFSPVTLKPKLLLQLTCEQKLKWDTQVPEDIKVEWEKICSDTFNADQIKIPRLVGKVISETSSICCYVDASPKAYAAAVYLRTEQHDGTITTDLIMGKSRVAPLKRISIPRLELLAALIGARMTRFVRKELRAGDLKAMLWTDSMCVLHWLKTSKELSVFVGNRITEIKGEDDIEFRYVPTSENPADLATRGVSLQDLSSLWWQGPSCLRKQNMLLKSYEEPEPSTDDEKAYQDELKKRQQRSESTLTAQDLKERMPFDIDPTQYKSVTKLWRVTAYVIRAIAIMRKQFKPSAGKMLAVGEMREAKARWDRSAQAHYYPDLTNQLQKKPTHRSKRGIVQQLGLAEDKFGVIRCYSRIGKANLHEDTINPVLLPKSSAYTAVIIQECHDRLMHGLPSQTLAELRRLYWVPSGRSAVKQVIRRCPGCKRFTAQPFDLPKMPELPKTRVNVSRPFQHVGLDYFGPLNVRATKGGKDISKAWICLFTCLVVRAVHAELVVDMTTMSFLMALRRFFAIYGRPESIICDNAPQFKLGASVVNKVMETFAVKDAILWKNIPEYSPWAGGVYERMVGILKSALKKGIGCSILDYDNMQTVLAEAISVVNRRPLAYLEDEIASVITPSHFLGRDYNPLLRNFDYNDTKDPDYNISMKDQHAELMNLWTKSQKILQSFWESWEKQYLLALREKTPWYHKKARGSVSASPALDEIVLVYDAMRSRTDWSVARITALNKGQDGMIRSANIKLPSGKITTRPVNHLYSLEISPADLKTPDSPSQKVTTTTDPTGSSTDPRQSTAGCQRPNVKVTTTDVPSGSSNDSRQSSKRPTRRSMRQAARKAQDALREMNNESSESE